MEQIRENQIESASEDNLRKQDNRNNAILGVVGVLMVVISLYATLTGDDLLPTMWLELSIVVTLGLLYNWAIRKHRIDLRLGCVYTAVGVLISFTLLTIGLFASLVVVVYIPFSFEETFPSIFALLPFGISILVVYKVSEGIGLRVARKQWLVIDRESSFDCHPRMLYLAEKKWTNFWFYVFLYMFIEFFPVLLQTLPPRALFDIVILGGGFIVYFGRACYILKKG